MKVNVTTGEKIPEETLDQLVQLHTATFEDQRTSIAVFRSPDEVRALLSSPGVLVFWVEHCGKPVALADAVPTDETAADLLAWITQGFFHDLSSKLGSQVWYISAIVSTHRKAGEELMSAITKELIQNRGARVAAFDCNTRLSGFVPLVAAMVSGCTLVPGQITALMVWILGLIAGLDANPTWYLVDPDDKEAIRIVKDHIKVGKKKRGTKTWWRYLKSMFK